MSNKTNRAQALSLAYFDNANHSLSTVISALNQLTNLLNSNQDNDIIDANGMASLLSLVQVEAEQLETELQHYHQQLRLVS